MSNSRKRSASETSVTKKALICIADGSESLDVFQSLHILRKLTVTTLASSNPNKITQLKDSISISSDISFQQAQASADEWSIIVLPGGNLGVVNMLQDTSFVTLMDQCAISNQHSMVAAMGASATKLLPALHLADPLGASCFPPQDCTIIVKERDHVWTAPGLGTTTELIMAVAQQIFGDPEACRVAAMIQFPLHTCVCHTEAKYYPSKRDTSSSQTRKVALTILPQNEEKMWTTKKLRATGFWEIVWPALTEQGWSSSFDKTWQYISNNRQVFESPEAVIAHLECQTDSQNDLLLRTYRTTLQSVPATKKTKEELIPIFEPLFEHIVWKRLLHLGWKSKRWKKSVVIFTPENQSGKRSKLTEAEVIPFLLHDVEWSSKSVSLAIVDLYQSCKRMQTQMKWKNMDPTCVERETKKKLPALKSY